MLKHTCITFSLLILVSFSLDSPDTNYGPFSVQLNSFEVCVGPKNKDCSIIKPNIIGKNMIYLQFQVTQDCSPAKGKIQVLSNDKELTRFHMNKPCEHLFLKPIFLKFYNATKNCKILKGDYSRKTDFGQLINNYFGGSFFYGNITFRAQLYNNDCNFACVVIQVTLNPKIN